MLHGADRSVRVFVWVRRLQTLREIANAAIISTAVGGRAHLSSRDRRGQLGSRPSAVWLKLITPQSAKFWLPPLSGRTAWNIDFAADSISSATFLA